MVKVLSRLAQFTELN